MQHPKESPNKVRSKTKIVLVLVAIAGLIAGIILISGLISIIPKEKSIALPATPGYYIVSYISDGDTFAVIMDGREEKVRMIGVDTPETVKPNSPVECYGEAASNFLKSYLKNQTVRLESDPINQNRDRYDRLLRYVYMKDGTLVNKKIISDGYGFAYLSFPFTKAEEFAAAQKDARLNNRGVWSGQCEIMNPEGDRPKTNEL